MVQAPRIECVVPAGDATGAGPPPEDSRALTFCVVVSPSRRMHRNIFEKPTLQSFSGSDYFRLWITLFLCKYFNRFWLVFNFKLIVPVRVGIGLLNSLFTSESFKFFLAVYLCLYFMILKKLMWCRYSSPVFPHNQGHDHILRFSAHLNQVYTRNFLW